MTNGADLRGRIDAALGDFLAARSAELIGIDPRLKAQADAATALVEGGKRLRPKFCYWAWRAVTDLEQGGGRWDAAIIKAAASLELLQASAIVHDDLMDASDLRRGQPSAHRRFEAQHVADGWSGSAQRYGAGAAILLGDLLLGWSGQMFRDSGLPADRLMAAYPFIDVMRTEVMSGQYLDLVAQASAEVSATDAMRVVRYKSARYSVERPLHIGAALAVASPELVAAMSDYGLPLGEAFQLRDDLLGVFGDPHVTGKPAGDDLREGKRTVLVARTLEAAGPKQTSRFTEAFGDPDMDPAGVADLRRIIVETGARDRVENLIEELAATADRALRALPIASEPRAALAELAVAATARAS